MDNLMTAEGQLRDYCRRTGLEHIADLPVDDLIHVTSTNPHLTSFGNALRTQVIRTKRLKNGTRVRTCMGAIGTVRKAFECEDGSFNYRIVFDRHQPDGKTYYTEWITCDSFEVIA